MNKRQWHELFISASAGAIFGIAGYFLTKYVVDAIEKTEGLAKVAT